MSPRLHRRTRLVVLALLLSGVAAWLIPSLFSVEGYRRRLKAELERILHRQVAFGKVSVRLLPRPGFVIEDATIQEDPAFGFEPFVRVERVECDIGWQTLLGARLDFSHFRLQHPTINLVRQRGAGWNVERLILLSSAPSGVTPAAALGRPAGASPLELEVEDGRVNFRLGDSKKPLAITDLGAQLGFDPARGALRFRLLGNPVRMDLSAPTPGAVEVTGEWTPGRDLCGPLKAVVRARETQVYDWALLLSGRDLGLYGVVDAEVRVTGSIRDLSVEGGGQLSGLHSWEQNPPSSPMPWNVALRWRLDRGPGRLLLESTEISFADSHLRISGSIAHLSSSPDLDLVVALQPARLEDLRAVAGRLWTLREDVGIRGRVEGMLAIQGPWAAKHYGGFVGARDVALRTPSATFPISDVAVRINDRGARLARLKVTLAPHVALEVEGALDATTKPLRYELTLSAAAAPLREVMNFGRALGMRALEGWGILGSGSASLHIAGPVRWLFPPTLKGRAEFRAARLAIPGLTEPINIPRASLQVDGQDIVVDPLEAVLGTSVFSGRLEHHGDRHSPWTFDLHGDSLDLAQGASWFAALGGRRSLPLLQRLAGFHAAADERQVASHLFSSLNAGGRFSAAKVLYRLVTLEKLSGHVEVAGRVIRLSNLAFRAAGGQGRLSGRVELAAGKPARLAGEVSLTGVDLQSISARLPPVLYGARGSIALHGQFETTGLSQGELLDNLQGAATVTAADLSLAGFDPLGAFVRLAGEGTLEPLRTPVLVPSLKLNLQVHERRVLLLQTVLPLSGARLSFDGSQTLGGTATLHAAADLQHLRRRWLTRDDEALREASRRQLDFSGPLDKLAPAAK